MKRNRFCALALSAVLLLAGIGVAPAQAIDTNITLRVGLTINQASTFTDPKLENAAGEPTGYTFGTMDGTRFVSAGTTVTNTQLTMQVVNGAIQVRDTPRDTVLYTAPAGADLAIRPNSAQTWFKGYRWYGDFVYRITGSQLTVINYVNIEDYVKGVLPYEVNADWPIESLKAQAVCARSFALGTHKHDGYDLCNTTNCQVYLGANLATDNSDAAVDATRGEYLSYNGAAVVGYFFSSDGGATEDAANVWGGDYPYLKGKIDPYEDVEAAQNGAWSVTLTAEQVRQKLTSAGYSIGAVANVQITKRTATDNVNEVTVTDTTGKTVTISRAAVRTVFGLNSIRYTVTPNTVTGAAATPPQKTAQIQTIGLSTHKVTVDGKAVAPQGYLVNRENYFKLRDIAYILSGTEKQFNVVWDNPNQRILMTSGTAYEPVGGEMASGATAAKFVSTSDATILLDGKTVDLTGFRINGNNYYRIRDVGDLVGFGVDFNGDTRTVLLTGNAQTPTPPVVTVPTAYTFNGSGWGHSVGMSQYGAYAMARQGKDYEEILKFYFTGIEIGK